MIAILVALAFQTTSPRITEWQPFAMGRTPDGGLFDMTTASRKGSVVNAWVRLINVRLKGVNEAREQTDVRLEVDCGRALVRYLRYRVVRPDGTVLKEEDASAGQAKWQPVGVGMRVADARIALCSRVR